MAKLLYHWILYFPAKRSIHFEEEALMKIKHFLDTQDFTKEELRELIDLIRLIKDADRQGVSPKLLQDASLAMIFEEPSTRTRISFEVAMTELGGHALYLKPGEIHLGVRESIHDTARVISRMVDVIMARTLKHDTVLKLAEAATVPVINGLTDYNHPTQVVCDIFTMLEHMPPGKRLEDLRVFHWRCDECFELPDVYLYTDGDEFYPCCPRKVPASRCLAVDCSGELSKIWRQPGNYRGCCGRSSRGRLYLYRPLVVGWPRGPNPGTQCSVYACLPGHYEFAAAGPCTV
jgi:hypothetical protein